MSKYNQELGKSRQSRRNFLTLLGIGVLGITSLSTGMLGLSKRKAANAPDGFPGPDSMFHPASDPRKDPRRV